MYVLVIYVAPRSAITISWYSVHAKLAVWSGII